MCDFSDLRDIYIPHVEGEEERKGRKGGREGGRKRGRRKRGREEERKGGRVRKRGRKRGRRVNQNSETMSMLIHVVYLKSEHFDTNVVVCFTTIAGHRVYQYLENKEQSSMTRERKRLSVTNLSSENNLPTFQLNAPIVIRVKRKLSL